MNKNELIAKVAEDAKLTKGDAGEAVEATLGNIQSALQGGDDVRLVGFGTFQKVRRKARKGRNPQTGAPIKIKATNVVKFRPGKKLRDAV